mmetsp:Transcript_93956/g.223581  ORF Transcript_93956/g.223581 Transcript_93956/m.223581 type:complete len:437 (-) Transcript_93956:579-1889(-)
MPQGVRRQGLQAGQLLVEGEHRGHQVSRHLRALGLLGADADHRIRRPAQSPQRQEHRQRILGRVQASGVQGRLVLVVVQAAPIREGAKPGGQLRGIHVPELPHAPDPVGQWELALRIRPKQRVVVTSVEPLRELHLEAGVLKVDALCEEEAAPGLVASLPGLLHPPAGPLDLLGVPVQVVAEVGGRPLALGVAREDLDGSTAEEHHLPGQALRELEAIPPLLEAQVENAHLLHLALAGSRAQRLQQHNPWGGDVRSAGVDLLAQIHRRHLLALFQGVVHLQLEFPIPRLLQLHLSLLRAQVQSGQIHHADAGGGVALQLHQPLPRQKHLAGLGLGLAAGHGVGEKRPPQVALGEGRAHAVRVTSQLLGQSPDGATFHITPYGLNSTPKLVPAGFEHALLGRRLRQNLPLRNHTGVHLHGALQDIKERKFLQLAGPR